MRSLTIGVFVAALFCSPAIADTLYTFQLPFSVTLDLVGPFNPPNEEIFMPVYISGTFDFAPPPDEVDGPFSVYNASASGGVGLVASNDEFAECHGDGCPPTSGLIGTDANDPLIIGGGIEGIGPGLDGYDVTYTIDVPTGFALVAPLPASLPLFSGMIGIGLVIRRKRYAAKPIPSGT